MSSLEDHVELGQYNKNNGNISIRIKIAHRSDISLFINLNHTVGDLKEEIYEKVDQNKHDFKMRLIYNGKLLNNNDHLLKQYKIKENGVIHCVFSEIQKNFQYQHMNNTEEEEMENGNIYDVNIPEQYRDRGLNSLMQYPHIETRDVLTLRGGYRQEIENMQREIPRLEDESDDDYNYRVEEQWMRESLDIQALLYTLRNSNNTDNDNINVQRTSRNRYNNLGVEGPSHTGTAWDFFKGFVFGSLFGILMILFFFNRNFSFRFRIGILCGMISQLIYNIYTQNLIAESSENT